MIETSLPPGSYLASQYLDPHRRIETRRIYFEDGRVEAFDGHEWWLVCRFTMAQVRRAKDAIRSSGLPTASDLTADDVYDTAIMTYAWSLGDQQGHATNWANPAYVHPVFEALEAELDVLEAAAGAGWYPDDANLHTDDERAP